MGQQTLFLADDRQLEVAGVLRVLLRLLVLLLDQRLLVGLLIHRFRGNRPHESDRPACRRGSVDRKPDIRRQEFGSSIGDQGRNFGGGAHPKFGGAIRLNEIIQ